MQNVSALYTRLLADPEHVKEIKLDIAGTEYGQDDIYSVAVSGETFSDLFVGSCISKEIDLTIAADIPRMARIAAYTRLVRWPEVSEWVPSGVFYPDTRETDEVTGLVTIHGFDAMLKAEAVWWDPTVDAGEWPMSQEAAVVDIARRMGVSIDPRTYIKPSYRVEYPNDLSMREVLGHIAAANGGNWMMTGDGELLLLPLGALPPETSLLVDGEDGGAILFGEVRILV